MSEITLSYLHAPIHSLLSSISGLGTSTVLPPAPGSLPKWLLQKMAGKITPGFLVQTEHCAIAKAFLLSIFTQHSTWDVLFKSSA